MRTADIEVGADYEIKHWSGLLHARVIRIQRKPRRVFSGARWDTTGHTSTSPSVVVQRVLNDGSLGKEEVRTPQQIVRPWAEAAGEHAARQEHADRAEAVATALEERLGVRVHVSGYGRGRDVVAITSLQVDEAEALLRRLGGGDR